MWLTGLLAPQHVGSSQTRARTHVPCIGRQILNHCATREAPVSISFVKPLLNTLLWNLNDLPPFDDLAFFYEAEITDFILGNLSSQYEGREI